MTHGVHFLPEVDQIIVLSDGGISEVGTYRELLDRRGAFSDFLTTFAAAEQSDDISTDTGSQPRSDFHSADVVKRNTRLRKDGPSSPSCFTRSRQKSSAAVDSHVSVERNNRLTIRNYVN